MKKSSAYSTIFIVLVVVFILSVSMGVTRVVNYLAQNEAKRRFQNIYTVYSEALMKTVVEMSGDTGCYYSSDKSVKHDFSKCNQFYNIFVRHLELKKYCEDNALKNGCIPRYQEYTTKPECNGFTAYMINNYDDAFVLVDGSNIIVYNEIDKQRKPIFAVDVNGFSKPNKAGEDLFSMTIIRNSNGSYYFHGNISFCLPVNKGGIHDLTDIH